MCNAVHKIKTVYILMYNCPVNGLSSFDVSELEWNLNYHYIFLFTLHPSQEWTP